MQLGSNFATKGHNKKKLRDQSKKKNGTTLVYGAWTMFDSVQNTLVYLVIFN
jgi:hypothetical protein